MAAAAALLSLCLGTLTPCPSDEGPQCSAVQEVGSMGLIAVSPDDKLAALAGSGDLFVYNVKTGALTVPSYPTAAYVAFSPDGDHVVVGQYDSTRGPPRIAVVSLNNGTELWSSRPLTGTCNCVTYSPDGTRVASSYNNVINLWDAVTGDSLFSISVSDPDEYDLYGPVLYTNDGGRLISGCTGGGFIYVWNATTSVLLKKISTSAKTHPAFAETSATSVSPDGLFLAVSVSPGPDGSGVAVQIYSLSDYTFLNEFSGEWGWTTLQPQISFSRDWSKFVVVGPDGMEVHSVENGTILEEYPTSTKQVIAVSYFHTSDAIVSGTVSTSNESLIMTLWDYVGTLMLPTPAPPTLAPTPSPPTPAPPTPAPPTPAPPTPAPATLPPPTPSPPTPVPTTPAPPTPWTATPALVGGLCALAFFVGACLCAGLMYWWQWRRREGSDSTELLIQ